MEFLWHPRMFRKGYGNVSRHCDLPVVDRLQWSVVVPNLVSINTQHLAKHIELSLTDSQGVVEHSPGDYLVTGGSGQGALVPVQFVFDM